MNTKTFNSTTNTETSTGVLDRIAKPETAFWAVLLLVLFVSTPHLASTFSELNQFHGFSESVQFWTSWIVGVLFSIFLELGIMYFARNNKIAITIIFMVISFTLSLYNYKHTWMEELNFATLCGILISAAPPLLIGFVSHHVKINTNQSKEEETTPEPEALPIATIPEPAEPAPTAPNKPRMPENRKEPHLQVTKEPLQAPARPVSSKADKISRIVADLEQNKSYDYISSTHKVGKATISKIKKKYFPEEIEAA